MILNRFEVDKEFKLSGVKNLWRWFDWKVAVLVHEMMDEFRLINERSEMIVSDSTNEGFFGTITFNPFHTSHSRN